VIEILLFRLNVAISQGVRMKEEKVNFYSVGTRCSGLVWLPDDYKEGEKRAGIVIARGFGAPKEFVSPGFAKELTAEGYVAFGFDYRGIGESDGTPGRIVPLEQAEDLRNALAYLKTRNEVDPKRVGLFGDCEGGAHAIYVAGTYPKVQCLVVMNAAGHFDRWMRACWGYERYKKWQKRIDEDRKNRVLTGKSCECNVGEFLTWGEEEKKDWKILLEKFGKPKGLGGAISVEVVEENLHYVPESVIDQIECPIFLTAPEISIVVPWEETVSMYNLAKEPKKMWIMGADVVSSRYGAHKYGEGYIKPMSDAFISWFKQCLPPCV